MNKYLRILVEIGVICAIGWLLVYTALLADEANKRERELEARYATSSLVSCEDAVVRGPRGEAYKAFKAVFRDQKGQVWTAKVKLDHRFGKLCDSVKGK